MKKGELVENTEFYSNPQYFFIFIHDLSFSHGRPLEPLLESEGRFVNLFGNFSPLCAGHVSN